MDNNQVPFDTEINGNGWENERQDMARISEEDNSTLTVENSTASADFKFSEVSF
jgi:hypothetical protein